MDGPTSRGQRRVPAPASFTPFPRAALEGSITDRFAAVAARHVDDLAVLAPDGALTYGELDARSRAVAEAVGGGSEPVAVLCEQRPVLVTAVLGALRSGRPYVPLDPTFPVARLARTVERCGARTVVAAGETLALARTLATAGLRVVDADGPVAAGAEPIRRAGPDDLAYVYFTSGSTGEPKGVADTHRNVLHNVLRYTDTLGFCPDDRLTLLQRPAFSGAVSSMFGALLNGASCCPFDLGRHGAAALGTWLAAEGITVYHSVPSIFRRIAPFGARFAALRVVRLEGDRAARIDLELFQRHFRPGCVLVNGLGATECGLVRQFAFRIGDALPDDVPLGYPVDDMEVAILDPEGRELPPGPAGEIVVRSRFLAAGYWRDEERTAERFSGRGGGLRAYRTGDRGRLDPDGCLHHLGRVDLQPRFRGQLVEVDEIERALVTAGLAQQVAVRVHAGDAGPERLVAYVVPAPGSRPTTSALREAIASAVPAGSVPNDLVLVEALPLTPDGKVDPSALPALSRGRPDLAVPHVPPRSPLETVVATAWTDVLGIGAVGVRDPFRELGGDSLAAAEMLSEVTSRLGIAVPQSVLGQTDTIEGLAEIITRIAAGDAPTATQRIQEGTGMPVVFATGDILGGGLYVRDLARALGAARPFIAVGPHDPEQEPTPATIEAMAADRLPSVRAGLPPGPVVVGGYCGPGGLLAYELARQLEQEGTDVRLIVLVDCSPIAPRRHLSGSGRSAPVAAAARLAGRLLAVSPATRRRIGRARAWRAFDADRTAPFYSSWPHARAFDAYFRARVAYEPRPVDAPVHVLWPADDPAHPSLDEHRRGWSLLSPCVTVTSVPGTHLTAVTSDLPALAAAMRAAIEEIEAGERAPRA